MILTLLVGFVARTLVEYLALVLLILKKFFNIVYNTIKGKKKKKKRFYC